MIKVGQIYKIDKQILCVTSILGSISGLLCNIIDTKGFIYRNFCKDFEKNAKVIAEYPTWQEAVNSKEFKTENEELKEILERHKKATAKAQIRSCDIEIINAQLKELLKEIRQQITEQVFGSPKLQLFEGTFDNKLLAKIDEVLK